MTTVVRSDLALRSETAQQRAVEVIARTILTTPLEGRLPNVDQLRAEIGVGAGTVQKALYEIQKSGRAVLDSKPRQGTVLIRRETGALWRVAGLPPLAVVLPLPNSWEFQGLATGIRAELDRLDVPAACLYGHGSEQRLEALETGLAHVVVVSHGAAETWLKGDHLVKVHSILRPGSYYASDSVVVVARQARDDMPRALRIGIDRLSADHTQLTKAEFPNAHYIDVSYAQVPSALRRGIIDAAVWHRTALGLSLDDQGLITWPLEQGDARNVAEALSSAALVLSLHNKEACAVLDELDLGKILKVQSDVVAGDVLPLY